MKFEIKDLRGSACTLHPRSDKILIALEDIWLYKENEKNTSHCFQANYKFDYHEIQTALCGKIWNSQGTGILQKKEY